MDLSGQLHSVSAEVIHGDGVVPVTEVVLLTRRLLLPPHAAHGQQHGYVRRAKTWVTKNGHVEAVMFLNKQWNKSLLKEGRTNIPKHCKGICVLSQIKKRECKQKTKNIFPKTN